MRFVTLLALVFIAALAIAGYLFVVRPAADGGSQVASEERLATLGDPDALVTVTNFWSPICAHCVAFHRDVWPELDQSYVKTGLVRWRLFALPGRVDEQWLRIPYAYDYSVSVTALLECGAQNSEEYFARVDRYAQNFEVLTERARSGAELGSMTQNAGAAIGLDTATTEACLANQALAARAVRHATEGASLAERQGVRGVPSFLQGEEVFDAAGIVLSLRLMNQRTTDEASTQ